MQRILSALLCALIVALVAAQFMSDSPTEHRPASLPLSSRAEAQAAPQSTGTTFRYAGGPITSFAANPTDWVVLTGSSTSKTVGVTFVSVCGVITGTNPSATINFALVKRMSTDTPAGTAVLPTNMTGNGVAATAAASVYTSNPTSLGTGATMVSVPILNMNPGGAGSCVFKEFGSRLPAGPLILRGPTQQLAINLGGITLPSGASLNWEIEMVEL
jgi:hypothetical protein